MSTEGTDSSLQEDHTSENNENINLENIETIKEENIETIKEETTFNNSLLFTQPQWPSIATINKNINNNNSNNNNNNKTSHINPKTRTTINNNSPLTELIKSHKERQTELQNTKEEIWGEVRQHAQGACESIIYNANKEIAAAFNREKQIEGELKEIATRSSQLQKHMNNWAIMFEKLNVGLKEMGDVGNWARRTEEDLIITVKILEELSERKRRAQGM